MLKQKSLSVLLVVAAVMAAAAFAMPSTAQAANCTWTRQELVDKHVAGIVFTDLAGHMAAAGDMTVVNHSDPATGCNAVETLAVYRSTDARPPLHQKFVQLATVSVAPGETKTVHVTVPTCMYQIDAYSDIVGNSDQVNINEIPVLYGEVVGSDLCDAPVVTATPVPAPCILEGQKLVDAHVAGLVFTDLAGPEKAGKGNVTINNKSNCEVHETLASYRSTNARPPMNQKLYGISYITVAPHSVANSHVGVPNNCMFQIDAITGFILGTDSVTITPDTQVLYGEVVGTTFCDAPAVTPPVVPAIAPTVVVTSINNTNVNNNDNESHGGHAEITNSGNAKIGNITLAKSKPATQVVYTAYKATPVAVPITAKTGPEDIALVATLSTGSGLFWMLKRLIK